MADSQGLRQQLRNVYEVHGKSLRNLAFWAVAVYRFGAWAHARSFAPWRWVMSKCYGIAFLLVEIATGVVLPAEAQIGTGLHIIHSGSIKIHPDAVIGERCGIMHEVTLGLTPDREGAPSIGNDVFIGAGAKIIGPVNVGDGALIAANSLVITDVPAGATAIGIPARAMPRGTGQAKRTPRRKAAAAGEAASPKLEPPIQQTSA